MIVESMSFQQMRSQVLADYVAIKAKVNERLPAILKVMRKTRMTKFFKYYEVTTARNHNKWLYGITSDGTRERSTFSNACYFYKGDEIHALCVDATGNDVFYYTAHFFERYCERRIFKGKTIKDVIITFLHENSRLAITPTTEPDASGNYEVSVQSKYGVALGTMHTNLNFLELRTFINNDMLKGSQIETSYRLEQKFNLEVERPKEKSLKERPYLFKIAFPLPPEFSNLLRFGATRQNTAFLRFL